MSKLNREQVLSIKELRSQSKTNEEIAKHIGISVSTVSYWVKRLKKAGNEMTVLTKRGVKALEI